MDFYLFITLLLKLVKYHGASVELLRLSLENQI